MHCEKIAGFCELLRASKASPQNKLSMLVLFLGIVAMSVMGSITFMDKMYP